MPTVHTSTDEFPPILVVLYDDAIEPDATVAPEGAVRFTVMNQGSRAHDFVVSNAPEVPGTQRPTIEGAAVSRVAGIVPGDSADLVVELRAGRYILEAAAGGVPTETEAARAELTVQPADTYNVGSRREG